MEPQHIAIPCDDELDISMLLNSSPNTGINQMSDENLAEELQLQEVIISSFMINLQKRNVSSEIEESSSKKGVKEEGESSSSSQSLCEICAEVKDNEQIFPFQNCSHSFCTDCISKHVSITIKKLRTIVSEEKGHIITCPGIDCTSILEVDTCRQFLPVNVVSMWDDVICESMILPWMKFYCPYKNCSELLVKESGDGEVMREAECPFCHRLFCVKCNVPWHAGVDCEVFSRLSKDERERGDLMVHDLAVKNKWKRCANCKFYVERDQGCLHMTCRCGSEFCYACGKAWSSTHQCNTI